jgi:formamidopyrimidine-DNA glycosylase
MPELPEVETVLRTLAARLPGRRVLEARFYSSRVAPGDPAHIAGRIRGRVIRGIARRGKFLVLDLGEDTTLAIHLGMTGRLVWQGTPGPHTRALFVFDRGRLVYDDIRQFGRIEVSAALPARIARLGPDALSIPEAEFAARLRGRRGLIKPLLLNQTFVSGMGNIYTDEALFRARIHPRAPASRLSPERVRRLHQAMREILAAAVSSGGSSISNYVDADGRAGSFQFQHQVYGRAGEPCPACGAPIRRIVIAQRGTHYCPKCQRA